MAVDYGRNRFYDADASGQFHETFTAVNRYSCISILLPKSYLYSKIKVVSLLALTNLRMSKATALTFHEISFLAMNVALRL